MRFIDLECFRLLEEWERTRLPNRDLVRISRWQKYLEDDENAFAVWQEIWQTPGIKLTAKTIANEMSNFYHLLSQNIHKYNGTGDQIVWRRGQFSAQQNAAAEYICKNLPIKYRVDEEGPADFNPTGN
jgi:hypothetical protein